MIPGRSRVLCRNKWHNTQNAKANKALWTDEEDDVLREIVQEHGTKHWTIIATYFNRRCPDRDRKGKQCRDRWLNYLDPEINKYAILKLRLGIERRSRLWKNLICATIGCGSRIRG